MHTRMKHGAHKIEWSNDNAEKDQAKKAATGVPRMAGPGRINGARVIDF